MVPQGRQDQSTGGNLYWSPTSLHVGGSRCLAAVSFGSIHIPLQLSRRRDGAIFASFKVPRGPPIFEV